MTIDTKASSFPHSITWHKESPLCRPCRPHPSVHQPTECPSQLSSSQQLSFKGSRAAALLGVAMQSFISAAVPSSSQPFAQTDPSISRDAGTIYYNDRESMASNSVLRMGENHRSFSSASTSYGSSLYTTDGSLTDIVPSHGLKAFDIPLQIDRATPVGRLHLALTKRNVFFHPDYAEIKRANVKTSGSGIDGIHMSFFVSKFSPLQRGFDGLCGLVHELNEGMYLDNHPGVPKQLRRLKYFVGGLGPKVILRDPTAQQTIEVWAFSSRAAAEKKALALRKIASAVHTIRRNVPEIPLGNVVPITKGGRSLYRVKFQTFAPAHIYQSQPFVSGEEDHRDFSNYDDAQRFADALWKLTNPRALPFISPSKSTLLNAVRLSPNQRTEQFFSSLRNLTFLALGTVSKPKAERVARVRLDRMFRKETDAWEHARRHRPKRKLVVTMAPLPSKLALTSHRPSYDRLRSPLKGAAPKRVLEALGALLPDDAHRTQQNYRRMKQLRGTWRDEQRVRAVQPWQIEALRLRLHPSAGNFSQTWQLWNRSKARMKHRIDA